MTQAAPAAADLHGVWKLVSYEARDVETGTVEQLFGPAPRGYITYTAGGRMSVVFMAAERPTITGGDVQAAPVEERLAAFDSCNAYSGTYEVEGGVVRHHVEVALYPNWVDGTQVRHISRDGDRLTLSSDPMLRKGRLRTVHLTWERAEAGPPA